MVCLAIDCTSYYMHFDLICHNYIIKLLEILIMLRVHVYMCIGTFPTLYLTWLVSVISREEMLP